MPKKIESEPHFQAMDSVPGAASDASRLLQGFFDYLCAEKRAAAQTQAAYKRDLLRLQTYCAEQKISGWSALQSHDVRQYIAGRHKNGIGGKTIQRELAAMRSFYRYLQKKGLIEQDPLQNIRAPKSAKKLPRTLDVDQVAGILDATADEMLEIRDLAMFELFYSSGLRLSELVMLDIGDISFGEGFLRVRAGKGGKQRQTPVGGKALLAIGAWLNVRADSATTALFVSARGGRLGPRSVQLRLERWCRKHDVPEHVHPHMLRHSFASHLLESAQDIRAVQELLGHSNIGTTQIYTHLDFQYLSGIYDKTHPRAKKKPE
ncbi:MAG: tyrosine recombinase XerC [Methylococcales bacterium]|nr:tyrosine recombinase XerC [Methylococcales bacterium]